LRDADHQLEMPEVRRVGGQVGGDHDLLLVDSRLAVVSLQQCVAVRAHRPRVMVADVHQPGRHEHRLVRLDHPGAIRREPSAATSRARHAS